MVIVTVACPCCGQKFTGTGETEQEASELAHESLNEHLDLEIC